MTNTKAVLANGYASELGFEPDDGFSGYLAKWYGDLAAVIVEDVELRVVVLDMGHEDAEVDPPVLWERTFEDLIEMMASGRLVEAVEFMTEWYGE